MKVVIDKEKCIGCGSCAVVCPDYFELRNDDNKAYIKEGMVGREKDHQTCIKEAVEICPVEAIELKE